MSYKKIILSDDQIPHFDEVMSITDRHPIILNTTPTGGGKSIIVLEFIRRRNIKRAIIICGNSVQVKHWEDHRNEYNVPIISILTYDNLRGSSTIKTPNGKEMCHHGLLYKTNDGYEPSEIFMSYVEEGDFLLVIDESHSIKNDSGKTAAVKALSRYITIRNMSYPYPKGKSYSFYCSFTPFDDPIHVINFGFTTGVIRSENLFCPITNRATGIIELYNYCKYFNPEKTENIWGTSDVRLKTVNDIAYKLLIDVFLVLISSFAKNCQANYISKQSIYYAYFDIREDGIEMMKKGIEMIKTSVRGNEEFPQHSYEPIGDLFNQITNYNTPLWCNRRGVVHGMITTQTVKTYYSFLGFIIHIFNTVPNSKIIFFVNYKESISIVMRYLLNYNPVKITGESDCTEEVRNNIISKFNEPNLESRLLIIMSQIGSDGIQLDDKHGGFPRISLAFPDFYHSRLFQSPGRTLRRFTLSNSLFFFGMINSEECPEESIMRSVNNKSKVMEETLRNNEIIPPMYYEKIINPQNYDLNELLKNAGMEKIIKKTYYEKPAECIIKISRSSITETF